MTQDSTSKSFFFFLFFFSCSLDWLCGKIKSIKLKFNEQEPKGIYKRKLKGTKLISEFVEKKNSWNRNEKEFLTKWTSKERAFSDLLMWILSLITFEMSAVSRSCPVRIRLFASAFCHYICEWDNREFANVVIGFVLLLSSCLIEPVCFTWMSCPVKGHVPSVWVLFEPPCNGRNHDFLHISSRNFCIRCVPRRKNRRYPCSSPERINYD